MVKGVGLGLRRDLVDALLSEEGQQPDFVELAPENWMGVGGYWGKMLGAIAERYPLTAHGLSLSLGSPEPLDFELLRKVKRLLEQNRIELYSEHLSYTKCGNAHLYDLLPIPFRDDAIRHVAGRIRDVQDFLGQRICIENVSYYTAIAPELGEAEFISSILRESDCDLLLDINNVYVNSVNHSYDAREFLRSIPLERVRAIHVAGHTRRSEDLIIDSHGEPIIDEVYQLFDWSVAQLRPVPVLLERDFNFPEYSELLSELSTLGDIVQSRWREVAV